MKKILCLCLLLFLIVACSSEKDAQPNSPAAPAPQTAAAPEAITSLSGDYVLTQTDSAKTKNLSEELTCTTTHTFKLSFITNNSVHYTAKSEQTIDPPTEGVACMAKLYNADEIGTYNIKDGRVVEIRFSPSDKKIPWVDKGYLPLKLDNINELEIFANGAKFVKQ
ncbi:MAG TPA: hypothetical protein PKJ10_02010 [Smithella sp.]|nr:hypothetical protein [Smithella sp.]